MSSGQVYDTSVIDQAPVSWGSRRVAAMELPYALSIMIEFRARSAAQLPRRMSRSCLATANLKVVLVALIRFTVADRDGTSSFVGPGHAIKMLVAACAKEPDTLGDLLQHTRRYDDQFATRIMNGLTVFDEHNVQGDTASIESTFSEKPSAEWPPFRVFNDVTRRASTQPCQAGLIVLNLKEKRIIQVQNSYAEIQRCDRGRIRAAGQPTRTLYHYTLPQEWALVP